MTDFHNSASDALSPIASGTKPASGTAGLCGPPRIWNRKSAIANGAILTVREQQILEMLSRGETHYNVSRALKIHIKTADSHVHNLLKRLKAKNSTHAVRIGFERGILT